MFSKIFEMILYRILILFLCSSTVLLSHELTDFDQYFYESRIYHENFENENSETNLESLILELDSYDDDQSFYYKIIAYDSLGLYLVKHGKLSEAAKYFNAALRNLEITNKYNNLKPRILLHLGLVYLQIGWNDIALGFVNQADSLSRKYNQYNVLIECLKYGVDSLESGIKIAKKIDDKRHLHEMYVMQAVKFIGFSNDSSQFYLDSANSLKLRFNSLKNKGFYYFIARVNLHLNYGDLDSALFYSQLSKRIANSLNDVNLTRIMYLNRKNVFLSLGDTIRSRDYAEKAKIASEYLDIGEEMSKRYYERKSFQATERIRWLELRTFIEVVIIIVLSILLVIIFISIRKIKRINIQLTESNDTRDRLFSIISHDLRGVILSIHSFASKPSQNSNRKIKDGTDKLLIEFDNLLYWSSKHLDKIIMHPELIDLNEMIDEIVDLFEFQISQKNIIIKLNLDEESVAYADYNTIRVVIRNILHNAIKYSPKNSVIEINVKEIDNNTRIDIVDSGSGFDVEQKSKKGLGLGLDLSKDFINLNKGEILIDSSCDGSSVSILLPSDELS